VRRGAAQSRGVLEGYVCINKWRQCRSRVVRLANKGSDDALTQTRLRSQSVVLSRWMTGDGGRRGAGSCSGCRWRGSDWQAVVMAIQHDRLETRASGQAVADGSRVIRNPRGSGVGKTSRLAFEERAGSGAASGFKVGTDAGRGVGVGSYNRLGPMTSPRRWLHNLAPNHRRQQLEDISTLAPSTNQKLGLSMLAGGALSLPARRRDFSFLTALSQPCHDPA
jgi:hypothetical protein